MAEPTPTAANPGGAWYDPLANLAFRALDGYTKLQEVKASAKPNNATVRRPEDINPATGTPYGVQHTGTAGVSTSTLPPWLLPVALIGGGLILVLALVGLGRGRGKGD